MKPATPLPWVVSSTFLVCNTQAQVIADCSPMDIVGLTPREAYEIAPYIVHTCNAYPRLIEALRAIQARTYVDAEGPELRAQNECNHREASNLLRELGEL